MKDTALYYASLNYAVFPLEPRGKKPITAHGLNDATTDTESINHWWNTQPNANIGLRCNGLLVIDVDGDKGKESLIAIESVYEKLPTTWTVKTGRGGTHFIFKVSESLNIRPGAGKYGYEHIDIRANDSYIVAAGSVTENEYITTFGTPDEVTDAPEWLIDFVLKAQPGEHKPAAPIPDKIPEGQRNSTLASLAGSMQRRGSSPAAIEAALITENNERCIPPLPIEEIKQIVASITRYKPADKGHNNGNNNVYTSIYNRDNTSSCVNGTKTGQESGQHSQETGQEKNVNIDTVLEWIKSTSGWFETSELDKDLGIVTTPAKDSRRKILLRLKERGVIQAHQTINRRFRYINTSIVRLDYKNITAADPLPIKWPFKLEKVFNMYPGGMAVFAGVPNEGKTAVLLNFLYLNNDSGLPIYYICSEMGDSELRSRLDMVDGMDINDWHFEAISKAANFEDVVVPDAINIIDYLEITTNLYDINTYLTAIQNKLESGIAVIAIQKKKGAELGRGAEFSLEKPKLYVSLDSHKAKIVKAKSWAVKNYNPNGLICGYKVIDGWNIEQTTEWQQPSEDREY
jgi:hypothetical protein